VNSIGKLTRQTLLKVCSYFHVVSSDYMHLLDMFPRKIVSYTLLKIFKNEKEGLRVAMCTDQNQKRNCSAFFWHLRILTCHNVTIASSIHTHLFSSTSFAVTCGLLFLGLLKCAPNQNSKAKLVFKQVVAYNLELDGFWEGLHSPKYHLYLPLVCLKDHN
jgi:hypothetical protein